MAGYEQSIYVVIGALLVASTAVVAYLAIISFVYRRFRLMLDFHEAVSKKIDLEAGYSDDQIDRAYLDKYVELRDAIETWLDREGMVKREPTLPKDPE